MMSYFELFLKGFSDEFELEACLYSDKSSGRLKEQYKEWSKTMRKEGVALFKTVRHKVDYFQKCFRGAVDSLSFLASICFRRILRCAQLSRL